MTKTTPTFASTRRPSWLWRFLNRNRAWCVTPDPPRDPRTLELRRRGENVLEAQMRLRVLAKWKQRHIADADGHVKRSLLTPLPVNVVVLKPRTRNQELPASSRR